MKQIYLDNSATTPVRKEVLTEMLPYFSKKYGNPSSFHSKGLEARNAVEDARKRVALVLNCKPEEVIFTSGGTESINLALKGAAFANRSKGEHIITSKIEHHAVIEACKYLEKKGFKITYLDVDKNGLVNPADVEKAITDKTILVSIIYANNEIGTIEPIREIGAICRKKKALFHSDACQAPDYLDARVSSVNADLLTLNGSKIYGPKGVGILYVKNGVKVEPLMHGGGQEHGLRSGTENVPAIIGFARALELAQKEREKESRRLIKLRDNLIKGLLRIKGTKLNGDAVKRLPNNICVSFSAIEGESIVLHLNEKGIFASTGSACSSRKLEVSHVLQAIGLSHEESHGSIRFSLGRETKESDIRHVIRIMPKIVEKLRKISPIAAKHGEKK
jgi:cysteine desulfurase